MTSSTATPAPTLDKLQTQIDAMKAFIGIDGYRAGQQRIRDNYISQLQDIVADAKLVISDSKVDSERREAAATQMMQSATLLKGRIDQLDKELGAAGEDGNRATRRRNGKRS